MLSGSVSSLVSVYAAQYGRSGRSHLPSPRALAPVLWWPDPTHSCSAREHPRADETLCTYSSAARDPPLTSPSDLSVRCAGISFDSHQKTYSDLGMKYMIDDKDLSRKP